MGAWDATSFGNDTACDWAYDLEESEDTAFIEQTIQKVLDLGDEYLDADDASEAVAAAEMVAYLRGHPAPAKAYTETVTQWVAAHPLQPSTALVQKALAALERIQNDPSELPELWEGDAAWTAAIADLRARLLA